MFYLAIDPNNHEAGLEIKGDNSQEIDRGRKLVLDLAYENLYGDAHSADEALAAIDTIYAVRTNIEKRIPTFLAALIFKGIDDAPIFCEASLTRFRSDGESFEPDVEPITQDSLPTLDDDPHTLAMCQKHGLNAVAYATRFDDFGDEHTCYTYGTLAENVFTPFVSMVDRRHPVFMEIALRTMLSQKSTHRQ